MTVTAFDIFHSTTQKTNDWLRDLMAELHWDDPAKAYSALRATLHALRDRLTVEETAQLAAQMPMLVRGFFYEGWKPSNKPMKIRHLNEFLDHVQDILRADLNDDIQRVVRAVFKVLATRVSEGEVRDIVQLLPRELRELWP